MSELTTKRTLVKSPPELWAEVSDLEALAKHLGEFGEIKITRLEPPRLLSYTFEAAGPESEVTFELEPRGKDVLLVITHRRIKDRKTMINVASGWDTHVGILGDRLNGVEPRPFWSTHAKLVGEYEARL